MAHGGDLVENFINVPDNGPRIVVIGETGCGKSSLLNKISGVRYIQVESESGEVHVERSPSKEKPELFVSARGRDSVTQRTSIRRTTFFLDPSVTLYLIDTPGTNDGSSDGVSRNHSTDVQLKLQRLQFVHLLLVCVPGLSPSGRIKHSTRDFLRGVARMFEDKCEGPGPRQCFWDHVVLAYTQCDEWNMAWRQDLTAKKKELRTYLAAELEARRSDGADLPILNLSSVQATDAKAKRWSQTADFANLCNLAKQNFDMARKLRTTEVLQFANEVSLVKTRLAAKQQELVAAEYDKDQLQLNLQAKADQIRTLKASASETIPQVMRVLAFLVACSGLPRTAVVLMVLSFFKEKVYALLKLLISSNMLRNISSK